MVSASGGRWFEHVGWSTRVCCVCVSHGVPAVVGTSMMFLCSEGCGVTVLGTRRGTVVGL